MALLTSQARSSSLGPANDPPDLVESVVKNFGLSVRCHLDRSGYCMIPRFIGLSSAAPTRFLQHFQAHIRTLLRECYFQLSKPSSQNLCRFLYTLIASRWYKGPLVSASHRFSALARVLWHFLSSNFSSQTLNFLLFSIRRAIKSDSYLCKIFLLEFLLTSKNPWPMLCRTFRLQPERTNLT